MIETKEIQGLQFGILSREEILRNSVCEVNNSKLIVSPGTVYDERMGTIVMKNCVSCNLDVKGCPGHFGHIELFEYIIHPLFYKYTLSFLKCFCVKCFRMIVSKETLEMEGLTNITGEIKFKLILKLIEKIDTCFHCLYTQPKFSGINDGKCNILSIFTIGKDIKKFIKTPEEIKMIFDNIIDDDVRLVGLNPRHTHPRNFITNIIPVLPPRSRPRVSSENNLCDDDITIQYCEIIKKNTKLKSIGNREDPKYIKEFDKMYFKIKSMFDNSNGKAKHSNGRAIKGEIVA